MTTKFGTENYGIHAQSRNANIGPNKATNVVYNDEDQMKKYIADLKKHNEQANAKAVFVEKSITDCVDKTKYENGQPKFYCDASGRPPMCNGQEVNG